MQTKHFLSDPKRMVELSLKSLAIVQPELTIDLDNKTVYAPVPTNQQSQVSIVSGGGAGHEPSFTGLVGDGILTAAVSGSIFASPSFRQVLKAIENVDSKRGILLTVMRYTGDILNFGVALENARARNPDLQIEMLVVNDDVAVTRNKAGKVGRRGIAGTVLVHKITGALAAAGYGLSDVARIGQLAADNLSSIGVSLGRVHIPGQLVEEHKALGSADVELGMGIHNETGCGRRSGVDAELSSIVREMLRQLLDSNDQDRNFVPKKTSDMVVQINNLGALSVLELGAVTTEVLGQLKNDWHINATRVYAGTFMTSLDGPGFSISLLNTVDTKLKETFIDLLDAPSNVRGWQSMHRVALSRRFEIKEESQYVNGETTHDDKLDYSIVEVKARLQAGLQALIKSEPEVTRYDSIVGDGDCGTTLARGAEAIQTKLAESDIQDLISLLASCTSAVEDTMDGTSGALYAIFTNALLRHVKQMSNQIVAVDAAFWSEALAVALCALGTYTPAQVGDRTMMDALIPFCQALKASDGIRKAADAAVQGAENTKKMRPGLGRSVYIGDEDEWLGVVPDPGAWGLSKFLRGLAGSENLS